MNFISEIQKELVAANDLPLFGEAQVYDDENNRFFGQKKPNQTDIKDDIKKALKISDFIFWHLLFYFNLA